MHEPGLSVRAESALASSFRDPSGGVFTAQGRIYRIVNSAGLAGLNTFLSSQTANQWARSGAVVSSTQLDEGTKENLLRDGRIAQLYVALRGECIFEHERIDFPSFPYEWPAEMLYAAAALTLDLAIDLAQDGLGIKDATPYNVLFRGPHPVFVDVLSCERRDPGDPTWLPYAQFVRAFLLPLLVNRYLGISIEQSLFCRRDGLEPDEVYRWLRPMQRVRPPFLSLISIPVWLGRKHRAEDGSIYQRKLLPDPERAQFVLESMLKGLKRNLRLVAPRRDVTSGWSNYTAAHNYTVEQFTAKEQFVQEAVSELWPKAVLDVGCNTGHFSVLAARAHARVVSIDSDATVLGSLWRTACNEKLEILPLTVNLTRPTPGVGWQNREWPSFLDRARGAFDMVFMLAVVHHMLITERVPLDNIIDLAADLTMDSLLIEYIDPHDSMFRRLTRGREHLYQNLSVQVFEEACRRRFDIVRAQPTDGATRRLYLMRRKSD